MFRQPSDLNIRYDWWRNACKGIIGPIHEDQPMDGYYRLRNVKANGDGTEFLPVAIFLHREVDPETGELANDEKQVAWIAGKMRDPANLWTWVAKTPVSFEAFTAAAETGKWPEEAPGDNFQPSDSFEALKDQLEASAKLAGEFQKIENQLQADQAGNLAGRLHKIQVALEAMRKVEKKPFDDGAAAVQTKFRPLLALALDSIDRLKAAMTPFMQAAEQAARAAVAEQSGDAAAATLDIKSRAGGMSGRRMGLRKEKIAVIVDYDKALAHVKDMPGVREAVEKVVKALVKAGQKVPGVEVKEEAKVQL